MTSYSWTTGTSGVWGVATNWAPATVPNDVTTPGTADVTIDAPAPAGGDYTVTIPTATSETINSLIVNGATNLSGSNSFPYQAAAIEIDGTLVFAPGSAGLFGGSLQTYLGMNGGTIVNAGTINAFVQTSNNVLFTGTNGIYFTNEMQALGGTITIDPAAINEISGNTLFDGIYDVQGVNATINLGGTLTGIVNIATIEGPPLVAGGWTQLTYNDPTSAINEWNGTAYVPIESTLTDIAGAGTVDVLDGRDYTTPNSLNVDASVNGIASGLLNLQAGTVTTASLNINGGIVQGYATIAGPVVNDGTLIAVGGTLTLTGSLSGTGTVAFDFNDEAQTVDPTGATLSVEGVAAGQTIVMNGSDTLVVNALGSFAGTIDASVGDTIILTGVTATSASLNTGTLVVFNGTQAVGSLALAGNYASDHVAVSGTDLTFAPGAGGPSISGAAANQAVSDTGTIAPFSGVAIADTSVGQAETVTVTLSTPANGTLGNLGGGTYDATTGVYTDTGSASAVTSALAGLVFTPAAHQVAPGGTVTTTFSLTDIDTGLATATDSTTSVIATAGTASPTITGSVAGQAVTDTGTIAPLSGVTIADANFGQTQTVTVTLSSPANGTLTNLGGGSYDAVGGVFTVSGTAAAVTAAVDGLVFTPTAQEVAPGQAVTTVFSITDLDTALATATDSTASVIATAGTLMPTIAGSVAGQTVLDIGSIAPFSGVTIGDGNFGQTETVTVTLSAPANGVLTNLGGGSYDATAGVYTDVGSASAVTTDLDALVFEPTTAQVLAGQTVTTGFTISDTDTAGVSVTDATTSVIASGSGVASSPPPAAALVPDNFFGGATSGVLFADTSSDVAVWGVTKGVATVSNGLGTLTGGWSVAGTGNFHGTNTTDILFQNTNGDIAQWQMQGGQSVAATTVGVNDPANWTLEGTGDFYGTGTDDVLFEDTATGAVAQWQVQNGVAVAVTNVGVTSSDWSIAAIGKLNTGAGSDSIVFINNNGAVADWTVVNGVAVAANSLGQTSSYWSIVGLGDFTGNGQNDLLFRGQNGEIAMWTTQNGVVTGAESIGMTTADWKVVGLGDYTGSGTDDILFQNTNGSLAAWIMSNGQVSSVVNVGVAASGWSIAPTHSGATLPS